MLKSLDSGLRRNDALKKFQICYEIVKFLFRSDWTLAASGGAYMKRSKGKVSFLIKLDTGCWKKEPFPAGVAISFYGRVGSLFFHF